MTKLLIIPGSLRSASSSRALARALAGRLEEKAEVSIADAGALPHYNADITDDAQVAAFKQAIADADGLVFVAPEYNYGVPGFLKNAIDWASRPAYESVFVGKPCFVITVSGGALGGVRAQASLKYTLNGMLAKVFTCKEVVVPFANQKVKDGTFEDETILGFAMENLDGFLASLG